MIAYADAMTAAEEFAAGSDTLATLLPLFSGVVVLVIMLAAALIVPIFFGILCKKLAAHKGYKGYFWMGFFFNFLGLVYVGFLPDLQLRRDLRAVLKRMVNTNDRLNALEESQNMQQN